MAATTIGAHGPLLCFVARPLLTGRIRSKIFLLAVGVATLAVAARLFATKAVRVKLLPFDNKSEIQVVARSAARRDRSRTTDRMLMAVAGRLKDLPELVSIQAYAGTAAPFNFNGLVRHYYLRDQPEQGDLSVNLVAKAERSRASHAIALDIRRGSKALPLPDGIVAQGRRGAARAAGAVDAARRNLRAGRRRRGAHVAAQSAQGVRNGRFHRRRRR